MINLDLLRLSNIFNPSIQPSPINPNAGIIMDDPANGGIIGNRPDLMETISSLLKPKEEHFNRFEDVISSMPKRSDYPPSTMNKILGSIAGLGAGGPVGISNGAVLGYRSNIPEGLKIRDAVTNAGYNRALEDWNTAVDPAYKIAQIENTRNINNRATALGTLQRKQTDDKLAHQIEVDADKSRQNETKLQIQRDRADAYIKSKEFAMANPDYDSFVDRNGELVYVSKDGKDIRRTGITKLSDLEKAELKVKGDIDVENVRQKNRVSLEGQRQAGRESLQKSKGADLYTNEAGETVRVLPDGTIEKVSDEKLSKVSGAGSTAKPNTPAQEKIKLANTANEVALKHPEWAKWIKVSKDGVSVTQPGGWSGPTVEQYDEIVKSLGLIKGGNDIQLKPEKTSSTPSRELVRPGTTNEDPKIKAARSKVENGYILITDGKGNFGQIKPSDQSKLPQGWMVVK